MKVSLISHTQDAFNLLLGTKSTRMRGEDPASMTEAEKWDHWQYMLSTIESPFEFVDYIFEVSEVSKNFTHQLVRTRTGAYQQETSRALDMTGNGVVTPENLNETQMQLFLDGVADADAHYQQLIAAGVQLQDARAILPSNMETVIKAKFNLRTMSDTAKTRLCARTQGEYQNVFRLMRQEILNVHPWADALLQPHCAATGTCKFPRWGSKVVPASGDVSDIYDSSAPVKYQCRHYDPRMDLTELKNEVRLKFWSAEEIAQANPVAHNGKSM